jgi:hypothetical protein
MALEGTAPAMERPGHRPGPGRGPGPAAPGPPAALAGHATAVALLSARAAGTARARLGGVKGATTARNLKVKLKPLHKARR